VYAHGQPRRCDPPCCGDRAAGVPTLRVVRRARPADPASLGYGPELADTMADSMLKRVADRLRGKFIVLDGPDGSGKTTQLSRLSTDLRQVGLDVTCAKDPGGTEIGERIRSLLLGAQLEQMAPRCEVLLFMASRAQLVAEVVEPAIAAGQTVLCDRFISATFAYQGAVGVEPGRIRELGQAAVGERWADITVILDLPADIGLSRAKRSASAGAASASDDEGVADAMERRPLAFHRRVREVFQQLPELYPKPVVVIDASGTPDEVYQRLLEALERADY